MKAGSPEDHSDRKEDPGDGDLPTRIRALFERGRAAWPEVAVSLDEFAVHVQPHLELDPDLERDAAGLYLACACGRGNASALAVFERELMPAADTAVARVDSSQAFVDEVRQHIRYLLFVTDREARARILGYSGRGPLAGWLRVVASRLALDLRRKPRLCQTFESHDALAADPALDPTFLLLGVEHAALFRAAVVAAFRALSSKQRTLLRLAYVEGLSGEDIGRLYGVNRSTVSRWLAEARAAVFSGTSDRVKLELHCRTSEVDSLLRVLKIGFDESLATLLESDPE